MHGDSSMAQIFQDIQHAAARLVAQVCKVDRGLRLSLWSSRFTLDAGLPTHLAGDGYHRGESWSASKTAYKRIVTATKGKGDARPRLAIRCGDFKKRMRPAVAASEDVRVQFVWNPQHLEVFEKLPKFAPLVFRQIFHCLRRAWSCRMPALYELHKSAERILRRAWPKRG